MKSWLLMSLLLLLTPGWRWLSGIRNRNAAVAAGQAAYARRQWATAAAELQRAAAATPPTPALLLNLGLAQAQAGQLAAARATYGRLLGAEVPPAAGSSARRQLAMLAAGSGQLVLALGLLREALRLDPANSTARYNYEVLRRLADAQAPPPPPGGPAPTPPKAPPRPDSAKAPQAAPQPGSGAPQPAPNPAGAGPALPQPRPGTGPAPAPPTNAIPNAGTPGAPQPLPTGPAGGTSRGVDFAPNARPTLNTGGRAPGSETARPEDVQLQTQRERLRALSLSPAQARQLLEALRAQENQYLQQLTPPGKERPDPRQPTW